MKRILHCVIAGLLMMMAALPAAADPHDDDIVVGVTLSGQLKIEFDDDVLAGLEFIELPPSLAPGISGWLGMEPGFDHLDQAEPDHDFYPMLSGTDIWLVGIDLDAGLFVREAKIGSPIAISPTPVLGSLNLGDEDLHTHVIWHIDSSAPGFDPAQTAWFGTFKLTDMGSTGYLDSEPFTLGFVPEPASALLLLAGASLLRRRKR